MFLFYVLAVVVLCQSVVALRGGRVFLAYVRREMNREAEDYAPFASVIVPCRGIDQGLEINLGALLAQRYPAYEIIFVVDRVRDPALDVIEEARRVFGKGNAAATRVVIAGEARGCGQKVHNLRVAVGEVDPASEVLVFVDTDARPHAAWLRSLVEPLADRRVGASTGYRWFCPAAGRFASTLRAVWNASIASALGGNGKRNFCWGGSTAIRRETFERLGVEEKWACTVSDDFTLTRTLHQAGLPIYFVPQCLTASHEDCTWRGLLEFTTRQLKITRVYAPHLWRIVLWSNLLFVSVFFGGVALVVWRAAAGASFLAPLLIVGAIYLLGVCKALIRLQAVRLPLAAHRAELRETASAYLLLWPFASALYLYNAIAAACSKRITWRGITYELKSPTETVIISDVFAEKPARPSKARHAS